ncbi:MAG: type II toxin-antitoxin system VapC family toxin [Rhodocyclaceae bacterium]|nr:type II toxin-antitoxin system VapC family toxin [Rhodocyclaceae bacterium]
MVSVDTNVLVRVLVDDPDAPGQCAAARTAVAAAGEVHVAQAVQIETVWVLTGAYGLGRAALVKTLLVIANHPAFHLQRAEIFRVALQHFQSGRADFADCLILAESAAVGATLATFDRKLGKLPGTRLVA